MKTEIDFLLLGSRGSTAFGLPCTGESEEGRGKGAVVLDGFVNDSVRTLSAPELVLTRPGTEALEPMEDVRE